MVDYTGERFCYDDCGVGIVSKSKNKRKNGKRKGSVWNKIKHKQRESLVKNQPSTLKELFGY